MTPDWLIQIAWFIASVFATGAIWYFLSQNNYHFALWSGFGAMVCALLAVTLLIRNDLVRREQATTDAANEPVAIHRFPTKVGKPRVYLKADRKVRLFVPVSFIMVTRGVRAELLRIGMRWEGWNLLGGWRLLKEIPLTSVNGQQMTAWDYRVEVPPATESPLQDLVFEETWSENAGELNWPKHSRLVLWARVTGRGSWEQEIGELNVVWIFPQVGESGFESTDTWAYSGGRNWTSDGSKDEHIWNR